MFSKASVAIVLVATILKQVLGDAPLIVGYLPASDVSEYAKIDLDIQALSSAPNLTMASMWYKTGGNSFKSDRSQRTLQGFSTSTAALKGFAWYETYKKYWNRETYADDFTSAACDKTGVWAGLPDAAAMEGCKKGAVGMNMWMYVIREMDQSIKECNEGVYSEPSNWDEAVAFYAGSLAGTRGTAMGVSVHSFAEKRCVDFNTCDPTIAEDASAGVDFDATVNKKIYALFQTGKDYEVKRSCKDMESTKELIVKQMAIPLIQGVLKYLYFAPTGTSTQRAELWSFAAAVLPYIDKYSPATAKLLRENTENMNAPVTSGVETVVKALQSAYPAMGMTCKDVGGLTTTSTASGYYDKMGPCVDSSTSSQGSMKGSKKEETPAYGVALAVIFSLLACCCIVGGGYYFFNKRKQGQLN